ncbi:Phage protein [Enterococcus phage VPE25]|nr:Phage protein [Enterococcus phage VPE25]
MTNFEITEDDNLTLDELLDSKEFKKQVNNLNHVQQMQPQSHTSNTLADTGRYPEN